MQIPFVDLKTQYLSIKKEIDTAIKNVIEESAFIKGKFVDNFEHSFAEKCEINNCIGVANGTDAIYIVLKSLGIGANDEVITVANSWISTSETISLAGARPIFVDIDPQYYTIDPNKIEEKITPKTKAIIPVHLYGQPAEVNLIKDLCNKYNLFLIEDCAQAHFARFNGQLVGTFGIASTFSFYPGKNLGCYGDGGAIITDNDTLAEKMRMFSNHGALIKHNHKMEGINSRLDGLQAAILSAKLPYLDEWNEKRYLVAKNYENLLEEVKFIDLPKIRQNNNHIFHLFVIRARKRDQLKSYLVNKGIETAIHYPTALPFLEAYKYLNHSFNDFPIASKYQNEILSLPMYPELTLTQIEYVANVIKDFYNQEKII